MARSTPDRFVVSEREPCYLEPAVRATLGDRVERALEELKCCRACPRGCGVNRLGGETGFCGVGRHAKVSSAFAHMGEEDCLRGSRGSGTIFFSMCNLGCVFCQNWDISQVPNGEELESRSISDLMLGLQAGGCHNINLVTPEHVVPQAIEAAVEAVDRGLTLPIVYNTSAYDAVSSLKLLDGLIDIYMPDFKFWSSEVSKRLVNAEDYPARAREAISEMHRQVGDLTWTSDGVACRGLLVRHLVMPGMPEESRSILEWLADEISTDTFVNIMGQYRPANKVGRSSDDGSPQFQEINRLPNPPEIEAAYEAARNARLWRFDRAL